MYVRPSVSGRASKWMPSLDVATRERCRLTPSSPWKYMTMRRFSSSMCTSGDAMWGVVASMKRSCPSLEGNARSLSSSSVGTSGGVVRKYESAICRLPGGWIFQGPRTSSAYASLMYLPLWSAK
jgi:hypothetical protein